MTPTNTQQPFERDKFKTLVHYICAQSHDPSVLGATKLNKVLWYSDVLSYLRTGTTITNETYIKQQFGPVPKHILPVMEELESEGAIAVRDVEYYGYPKREFVALNEPDISTFTPNEISIVDKILDVVCHKHTATSISMASHDAVWKLAEIGEEIPLYAVLASKLGEITESDVAWAKEKLTEQSA